MRAPTLLLAATLVGALAGCAGSQPPASPASAPLQVRWVHESAEYRAALIQTYALAAHQLAELTRDLDPGSWAVALDADETLISNVTYAVERAAIGERYTEESWDEWIHRRAAPRLPGVGAFLERVHELGGRIAVVTNRHVSDCPATRETLERHEVLVDLLLCMDDDEQKEPRWERIRSGEAAPGVGPLQIVMWIGDNITDFPGLDQTIRDEGEEAFQHFGVRYFVLPNPLYGSWDDN